MKARVKKQKESFNIPIIGKIKIGEKKISEKTGKEYPVSLDYFRATGKYERAFYDIYGDKPNRIQIIFYSDNIADICNEYLELRDHAGNLAGMSDGYEYYVWDGTTYKSTNKPDEAAKYYKSPNGWQRRLILRFFILGIKIFGAWEFSTKADKSSIDAIVSAFDFVQSRAGTVKRIPFDLTVHKHTSQKPNSKNTYPVVNLIPNLSDENLLRVKNFIKQGTLNLNEVFVLSENLLQEPKKLKE
jgi:hypothetical protein